jgi:hypothetical protein
MKHPDDLTLSAWIEGDLVDVEQRRWITSHVEVCDRCRDALQEFTALIRHARSEPQVWTGKAAAWEPLSERLNRARLSEPVPGRDATLSRAAASWRWRLWVPAGAGAALAVLMALMMTRPPASADPAVVAMLAQDAIVVRALETAMGADPAGGSRVIASASRDISEGVDNLERALRERPGDPALTNLLRRAVEHRAELLTEVPR